MPGLDWVGVEHKAGHAKAIFWAIVILVSLLAGVLGLIWVLGNSSTRQLRERTNEAILAKDPQQLLSLMTSEFKQRVEMPVLRAWMQAAAEHAETIRTGRESFQIDTQANQITQIKPSSGPLAGWKPRPDTDQPYRIRAQKLLGGYFTASSGGAMDFLPKSYRAQQDPIAFQTNHHSHSKQLGALQDIEFIDSQMDLSGPQTLLIFTARITGSQGQLRAIVTYRFEGLSSRLTQLTIEPYLPDRLGGEGSSSSDEFSGANR